MRTVHAATPPPPAIGGCASRPDRAGSRLGVAVVLGAALVVLLVGCGGTSSSAKINNLLSAGLKAQAAGDTATAAKDYNQVLALDPKNKFALYDLGLLDQLAGRTAAAEAQYRAALAIDPNFARALFNLAIIRTQPAPQEAVSLYRQEIALTPNDGGAHLNLGLLLISLGQTQQGSQEVAKAVSLNPSLAAQLPPPSTSPTSPTTPPPNTTKTTVKR